MKIIIEQNSTGTGNYHWKLTTGSESLEEAFEKVLVAETLNAQHYRED
jgi:hypothetical protein